MEEKILCSKCNLELEAGSVLQGSWTNSKFAKSQIKLNANLNNSLNSFFGKTFLIPTIAYRCPGCGEIKLIAKK